LSIGTGFELFGIFIAVATGRFAYVRIMVHVAPFASLRSNNGLDFAGHANDGLSLMSKKNAKVAGLIASCQDPELDPHYVGFFECFNRQLFFEAHEVLEELWLPQRGGRKDRFYKGLIQLAGAFVHLQKNRLGPAAALLDLAHRNLDAYLPVFDRLDVGTVLTLISGWRRRLEGGVNEGLLLEPGAAPQISLRPPLRLTPEHAELVGLH
jgi:hypothetical protein